MTKKEMRGLRLEWTKALRSLRYKQHFSGLRMGDRYSAYGVLCDIACPQLWVPADLQEDIDSDTCEWTCWGLFHAPPKSLLHVIGSSSTFTACSEWVEIEKAPFPVIAERLEAAWSKEESA